MPIDLKIVKGRLSIVCIDVYNRYYKRPFFVDDLQLDYGLKVSSSNITDQLMVKPLDYSGLKIPIHEIDVEEFIRNNCQSSGKILFIFHISRCGSTLITQMLGNDPDFFVLSEPSVINQLLNPELNIPFSLRFRLFKAILCAISLSKPPNAKHIVVKFRSWQTFLFDDIKKLFPDNPWMFVHRNCLEVTASLLQQPAGWLRSKNANKLFFSEALGMSEWEVDVMDQVEFIARILGRFFKIIGKANGSRTNIVDYDSLTSNLIPSIEQALGIVIDHSKRQKILSRSHIYSKDINRASVFSNDSQKKRSFLKPNQVEIINSLAEKYRKF